ncbi:MAG TPA: hypothetical protein PLJ47_15815 [Candidatus Hydrogenedentes bacterium]|nr:hypothetical protein [Candidatus Hydrogenedentota bacterium]HRK36064.1 hypothetical protein [Candidatus Hydrogenedentota bacterium]
MKFNPSVLALVQRCLKAALLSEPEARAVSAFLEPAGPWADVLESAESIHVHIKVDETCAIALLTIRQDSPTVDYAEPGFIKLRFPDGARLICSTVPVSQDELIETSTTRQPRPYLDHIGIDMRDETPRTRNIFDGIPAIAERLGCAHVPQGGDDTPVRCCHAKVKAKHWVYPAVCCGDVSIPLEFAFGELLIHSAERGCDLRPMDPRKAALFDVPIPACCEVS